MNTLDTHVLCEWECLDADQMVIQLSLDYSNGNTHMHKLEYNASILQAKVYGFKDSLDNIRHMDHSTDIIRLNNNSFDSGGEVTDILT